MSTPRKFNLKKNYIVIIVIVVANVSGSKGNAYIQASTVYCSEL